MTSTAEKRAQADPTGDPKPPPKVTHLTVDERVAHGRAARAETPRASHSVVDLADGRDPVAIVDADTPNRVPELVPIRYGRMLASPFAFFRGSAALMAHDLATTPRAGINVQLCGDAHCANFGGFASPERAFVFDLNDFDETLRGPFEWDVKRLAASFEIAGRHRGFSAKDRRTAVLAALGSYREAMRGFAEMATLEVWYSRLDLQGLQAALRAANEVKIAERMEEAAARARRKDSLRALTKLTRIVDGQVRMNSDPPLLVPMSELVGDGDDPIAVELQVRELLRRYRRSLQRDRRELLEHFRFIDLARKVVGVGSVGTRCWVVLLFGRDEQDPLLLQVKEAGQSVLEPLLGKSPIANHGQRVVEGQRLLQASSDIFLGWIRNEQGLDGVARDFYVRQLWDWKTSVDLEVIVPRGLEYYAKACGWTLARAHARSGDRVAIASYLGKGTTFDEAVADFASAYADVNDRDYATLKAAVATGTIQATEGL
jgi:uncharacterized protein (DUF2252 family)